MSEPNSAERPPFRNIGLSEVLGGLAVCAGDVYLHYALEGGPAVPTKLAEIAVGVAGGVMIAHGGVRALFALKQPS